MSYSSVVIIIPYFGKFPNYYPLFLKSCECNDSIDWMVITDSSEEYDYPKNVHVFKMDLGEIKRKVQYLLNFEVALNVPYKLCDFRPMYGLLFEEYIKGYDFWGYGDIDLIYGNIRNFLGPELLHYDKIFELGHLSFVRNTYENNRLFMQSEDYRDYYKYVFQNRNPFNFDETFRDKININMIFREKGKNVYGGRFCADIFTKSSDFILDLGDGKKEKRVKSFFLWENGELHRYISKKNEIEKKEYMYIHLQKRRMAVKIDEKTDVFKIIPNCFDELEVDSSEIKHMHKRIKTKHANLHYIKLRLKNLGIKLRR